MSKKSIFLYWLGLLLAPIASFVALGFAIAYTSLISTNSSLATHFSPLLNSRLAFALIFFGLFIWCAWRLYSSQNQINQFPKRFISATNLLLLLVFSLYIWYTTKTIAGYQIMSTFSICGKALNLTERVKSARSQEEFHDILLEQIDCMDQKIIFPGTLFFNKEQSVSSINIKKP